MMRYSLLGCVMAIAILSGCIPGMTTAPTQTLTGTLHSVRPVGGGEPTGWVLNMGEGAGTTMGRGGMGMNLDVSKVKKQAMELDGKQVTAMVRMTGGTYEVESFGELSPTKQ